MFNQKVKNMKKILSILLVTMFTMSSMVFAGPVIGEPSYVTVTNKTTNESYRILFSQFNNYTYTIDPCQFKAGFYVGDNIVVSYGGGFPMITPRVIWQYRIGVNPFSLPDTSLSTEFSIPSFTSDKQSLTIKCSYQDHFSASGPVNAFASVEPTLYYINIPNVYNSSSSINKRIDVGVDSWNNLFRVTYSHYSEVRNCLTKAPYVTVTNALSGDVVFKGNMNDNGEITFNTGGKNGAVIVNVTVDGIALPPLKTYIW